MELENSMSHANTEADIIHFDSSSARGKSHERAPWGMMVDDQEAPYTHAALLGGIADWNLCI